MRQLFWLVLALASFSAGAAMAAGGYKGLSLSTPYPEQTVQSGAPLTLPLTVRNFGLPPQTVKLRIASAPPGWIASFLGDGRPIAAVYVEPDKTRDLSVQLKPSANADHGTYRLVLAADGSTGSAQLPLKLTFVKTLPNALSLEASLPTLKGSPSASFTYHLTLNNKSEQDLVVNLAADAPPGFQVSFSPQFGSEEVTSLPVKAGSSKEFDAKVSLPQNVKAGTYPLRVRVDSGHFKSEAKLALEVTGQPKLRLTTPTGLLSGEAYVGKSTPVKLAVENTGTAPARAISLSADEPSEWEVKFDPKDIPIVAPGKKVDVTATVKPSPRSLAGDYLLTFNANSDSASASASYRVTVLTSTVWGIAGVGIIALAIGVVGFAVSRYGRR